MQEQINILELRVQEMIALIKRLKAEKGTLETEKGALEETLRQREAVLGQWEKDLHQFREDREAVRQRIGKIIEALGGADEVGLEGEREQ